METARVKGKYNFIYSRELFDLVHHIEDIHRMSEDLRAFGLKKEARKTKEIAETLDKLESQVDSLRIMWKALELFSSGLYTTKDVYKASKIFREMEDLKNGKKRSYSL